MAGLPRSCGLTTGALSGEANRLQQLAAQRLRGGSSASRRGPQKAEKWLNAVE
jgi:hypothetical protein